MTIEYPTVEPTFEFEGVWHKGRGFHGFEDARDGALRWVPALCDLGIEYGGLEWGLTAYAEVIDELSGNAIDADGDEPDTWPLEMPSYMQVMMAYPDMVRDVLEGICKDSPNWFEALRECILFVAGLAGNPQFDEKV
jgi:hypothetical protein